MDTRNPARRRFIRLALVGAAGLPLAAALAPRRAHAAGLPHLDPSDPTANALGYAHDGAAVDQARFPQYEPEQTCANCNLAQAPQDDGWLPCTIFPGKSVDPKGWCAAWVKKA